MTQSHRVVIVGGGFGGLYAAKSLRRAPVEVTLIDRRNFHLFQPLLYQVATGGISAANISAPLRSVLKRQRNTRVVLGEVEDFDLPGRRVLLADGQVEYDSLIVAAGAGHSYFGNDHWAPLAPGLKTIEDATEIRRRIFIAFEAAERETDPERRRHWMTLVMVGGGPTGVELAGAVAEIARHTLRNEFRNIDTTDARIILVEALDRVLPGYPADLSEKARRQLEQLGVTVRTGRMITDVRPHEVEMKAGDEVETVATRTVLWGAGVEASPLGPRLAAAAGIETDRSGHVPVEPDLSLPGYPEVLVIGDLARFEHQGDGPLPGVAPVAMQQGKYAARLVRDRLRGRTREPFRYRDYGTMATIGRHRAVAVIGPLKFSGTLAWLAWLFIHVVQLIEFRDRVFVLAEWAYNYITWNRDARLITGHGAVPLHVGGGPQTMPSPSAGDPAAKEPDHPSTERLHQI